MVVVVVVVAVVAVVVVVVVGGGGGGGVSTRIGLVSSLLIQKYHGLIHT